MEKGRCTGVIIVPKTARCVTVEYRDDAGAVFYAFIGVVDADLYVSVVEFVESFVRRSAPFR